MNQTLKYFDFNLFVYFFTYVPALHPGMMHSVYLLCALAHKGEEMTRKSKVKLCEFISSIGTIW